MKSINVYAFWAVLASVVLAVLKISGTLAISWLWVLAPIGIYLAILAIAFVVMVVLSLITFFGTRTVIRNIRQPKL